jgi:hypothetical protein
MIACDSWFSVMHSFLIISYNYVRYANDDFMAHHLNDSNPDQNN